MSATRCHTAHALLVLLLVVSQAAAFDVVCYYGDVEVSAGNRTECALTTISLNPCACEWEWMATLAAMAVIIAMFALYVLALANVYRAPWTTALHIAAGRAAKSGGGAADGNDGAAGVEEDVVELDASASQGGQAGDAGNVDGMDEVELEGEAKAPVPVLSALCERCGNTNDTMTVEVRGTRLHMCAGCYVYKVLLKMLPAHMFSIPLSVLYWWLGVGPLIVWLVMMVSVLAHVFFFVLVFVFARPGFGYMVARRVSTKETEESERPEKRDMIGSGEEILSRIRPSHQNELRRMLVEGEELKWAESVSVPRFLRHNFQFQLTLWVLIFLPLLYTALVFYFIFFSQSVIDVAFGCMVGIPLLFICIPAGLNYYMRCRCTYAITNVRLIRVNSTMFWFRNRVYSYPISRVTYLLLTRYSASEANAEGEVRWMEVPDVEVFRQFEYVQNVEEVRGLVVEHKAIVSEEDEMAEEKDVEEGAAAAGAAPPEREVDRHLRRVRTILSWCRLLSAVPMVLCVPLFAFLRRSYFVLVIAAVVSIWILGAMQILYVHIGHRIQCRMCQLHLRDSGISAGTQST